MSMESYDFLGDPPEDYEKVRTMFSEEAQEEKFGDIEVSGTLAQRYGKALKEAGAFKRC